MAIWGMGVMIGPIMGPTLGGYLTEQYDWRWVFYINLPFGLMATAGLLIFLPSIQGINRLRFDWLGFTVLSTGIGALQLFLDRGQDLDWFYSREIVVEAVLAGLGIYLFIVHMVSAPQPLIHPALFRDVNFSSGLVLMFAVGILLVSSLSLMTPWLQVLSNYPVETAGLVMAPRGLGNFITIMINGRLATRMDSRYLVGAGLLLLCFSAYIMTGWAPDVSQRDIIRTIILQGGGIGLVFTSLQVLAFATLPAAMRTEAASLFSLVRNIGAAIGVSVTSALLARNTQALHEVIGASVTPFNRTLGAVGSLNPATQKGAAVLDRLVNQQAEIIAYVNDYVLLICTTLPAILLLLLMRLPRHAPLLKPNRWSDRRLTARQPSRYRMPVAGGSVGPGGCLANGSMACGNRAPVTRSKANFPPLRQPVAVIQPLPGIGDMVWHVPHIRAIAAYSGAPVTLLTKPRSLADQILADEPAVGDIQWLDLNPGVRRGAHDGIGGFRRLVRTLRAQAFGSVVILHHSDLLAAAAWMAGIPDRRGYGWGRQRWFLNTGPFLPADVKNLHQHTRATRYLQAAGIPLPSGEPELIVPPGTREVAKIRLGSVGAYVAIGIGSSEALRQWGTGRFSELAAVLLDAGWRTIVLVGGTEDSAHATMILDSLGERGDRVRLALGWNLAEVMGMLTGAEFYVGNNTGVMNIAAAVGIRTYALFGTTRPFHHAGQIVPVTAPDIGAHDGMQRLTVTAALHAIQADRGGLSP